MTLQNNSLNSLIKDNSRALKPYIIFKTCVCFNQKHPRSQRLTLHFSFCLLSKCTDMTYLLYCTEALIPQSPLFLTFSLVFVLFFLGNFLFEGKIKLPITSSLLCQSHSLPCLRKLRHLWIVLSILFLTQSLRQMLPSRTFLHCDTL